MVSLLPILSIFFVVGQALAKHGFVDDKEYHYNWRGRIVGGITEIAPRLAGLGFKAEVTVLHKESNTLLCQVTQFKHAEINQEFDHVLTPFEEEREEEVHYEDILEEKLELVKHPFELRMDDHGRVVEGVVDENDPEWLLNMKKAFASAFNMDLYGRSQAEDTPLHYNVMEESVVGVCETTYSISPIAEYMLHKKDNVHIPTLDHPKEHLVITKTVNYSHCEHDNVWRHVSPGVEHCHYGEGDCTNKGARATSAMYIVEGSRHEFVIKYANIHGDYYFNPIGHNCNQEFDVFSVMELTLKDVTPVSHELHVEHPRVVTHLNSNYNLHMHSGSLVKSPIRGLTEFLKNEKLDPSVRHKLVEALKTIRTYDTKVTSVVQSLAFSVQQLHLDELKGLWEEVSEHQLTTSNYRTAQHTNPWTKLGMHLVTNNVHAEHTPEMQARLDVMIDILAMAGTNPSAVLLSNLITNGELTAEKAAQVLMTLPLTLNTPTVEVLEEFLELLKTEFVQNHETTLGAGMLALSNVIHNYCVNEHDRKTSYPDNDEYHHCNPHHPFILHEVVPFFSKQTKTYSLTIQKLKALGNLGIVETLPLLEPYILGEVTHDVYLRQTAIYGLTKLSEAHPHMVEEEVMPVFRNVMDNYEVRQAALMVALSTNPPAAVFQEVASSTWFEPSHHIQNYVYSIFDALVHNKFDTPYFTELKSKAKMAIHLTKPIHHGSEYTHFHMISNMMKDMHEGVLMDVDSLGNQNALLPSSLYVKLRELFGGKEYTNFEFKLFTEGFVRHVQNELGYHSYADHGKEFTAVWFKVLNNMERFITLEQVAEGLSMKPFSDFVTRLSKGIKVNFHKVLAGADVKVILPTELGLPLYINSHFPKYFDIHGDVKGELSDLQNFHLSAGVLTHVEHEFLFNAFVISPFDEHLVGAGFKISTTVHLPLNLEFDVDLHESNTQDQAYKLTWTIPELQKPLWKYNVVPYTFNKKFDYLPFLLNKDQKFVIEHQKHKYTAEKHVGKDLFGLDFVAKVETDRPKHSFGFFKESFMEHNLLSTLTNFYVPTSWHETHYSLRRNQETTTTNVVKADLKYTAPFTLEAVVNLEGKETHSYHATLHYESDEFHVNTKNVSLKLHQTHPNELPHDFQFEETLTFPDVDMTNLESVYNQDLTTKGRGHMTFGTTSKAKQQIDWRVTLEQTPNMKLYAQNTLDKKHCDKDHEEHLDYSHHCLNALYHATRLNKKTVEVVYEDAHLPPYVYNYAYKVLDYFKTHFYNYGTTDHTVTHKEGHLTFSVEHCPKSDVWDIEFIRPHESVVFQGIPELPQMMECMVTKVIEHPVMHLTHQQNYDTNLTPFCITQGAFITTFDNFTYKPEEYDSNCWYTVAKHCHDSAEKTEVMLKYVNGEVLVQVLLDDTHRVTLQKTNGEMVVDVNGETKDLPNNDKNTVEIKTDSGTVTVHGGKIHSSLTVLDFATLGFRILHDGHAAAMEVNQMHRNKLCGLCGDFNGEPDDDMHTSHDCVTKSPKEFVASWMHPSDTCHPPTQPDKSCVEPKAMTTAEATVHVRELYHENEDCMNLHQTVKYVHNQICISEKNMPDCKKECTALYPAVVNTAFYCDEPNEEMKNLAKQVHEGHFVDVHDHVMTYMDVTHARVCVH